MVLRLPFVPVPLFSAGFLFYRVAGTASSAAGTEGSVPVLGVDPLWGSDASTVSATISTRLIATRRFAAARPYRSPHFSASTWRPFPYGVGRSGLYPRGGACAAATSVLGSRL